MEIGITASPTTLIEEEATELTLTFNLSEPPPAAGINVTLSSPVVNALAQLDVFAAQFNGARVVGVSDDTNGLTLRITQQTATITLPVYNDDVDDSPATFTYSLEPSDAYTITPGAGSVTFTIEDSEGAPPPPPDGYDEAASGDISNAPTAPLTLDLAEGITRLSATSGDGDQEYIMVTIPEGFELSSLELESFSAGGDSAFIGVQEGTTFTEPLDDSADTGNILGYALFDEEQVSTDILDDIGSGSGTIGFDGPLPSGVYTFALQQLGADSDYTLAFNLSPVSTEPDDPVVSFAAVPTIVSEAGGTVFSFELSVEGEIPAEGLVVALGGDLLDYINQLDFNDFDFTDPNNVSGLEVGEFREDGAVLLTLTESTAFVKVPVFDDVVAEADQDYTLTLLSGEGYTVSSEASSATVTVTDGVPSTGGPTVSLAIDKTEVAEREQFTVNFAVDGDIPEDGLTVYVDSSVAQALSEFSIFGDDGTPLPQLQGIDGFPVPNGDASGFFVTLTDSQASITLSTFDDGANEGVEAIPFTLVDGESYDANPNASEVTLTIDDGGTPPPDGDGTPTVSLQVVAATFDAEDNLLAAAPVRSVEDGASALTFVFNVDGEIPEEGLVVTVNGDVPLTEYFTGLSSPPFSPGGEVLEAVYNDAGEATGFTFLITSPNAIVNLRLLNDEAATGDPVTATYSLEAGEGYAVDATAGGFSTTFYNSLDEVPIPTVTPEISVSISETTLIESEGTSTTLSFSLSEAPSAEGVLVYIDSPTNGTASEFDILNAEVTGGAFPVPNSFTSGFYFRIFEQEASITLTVFPDDVNPVTGATTTEGIESRTFTLQAAPGYTVNADASAVTVTIADTPDSLIQVSYEVEPTTLVESEGTVGVHTFTLSAPPPEGGITVSVRATNLGDFNLDAIEVEGGEITRVNDTGDGFHFRITEQTATINLPILDDTAEEFLERATFTVLPGEDYQVNANANGGTFTLVNTPDQVPPPTVGTEPSDTIELAQATNLSDIYPEVSIKGAIDHVTANRYETENGFLYVDFTEDVDFYKVDLKAGDNLKIDIDAAQLGLENPSDLDAVLRVFDAEGNQLAQSDDDGAPDEVFVSEVDSYLDFTAEADGTYYIGVSSFPNAEFDFFDPGENRPYDPLVPASGTGRSSGDYTLNLLLNTDFVAEPTEVTPGTGEGPTISLQSTPGTFDGDDNLLASALVQSLEDGASLLTLGLTVDGEIPEDGIEVILDSNVNLGDFFNVSGQPFSPGGEVIGAVYDEAGNATGIRFRITEAIAIINLSVANLEESPADGETPITFSLVPSAGYSVSETASSTSAIVYDSLADVPELPTAPEVSLSISETALVESEGNSTTLTFSLSEAPSEDGVLVYVDSGVRAALGEFDVLNAEITGGAIPAPNFQSSGFYFRILEQTASITLSAFDETTIPGIDPEVATEGVEEFTFTVQPGVGYAIDPDAGAVTLTIADNPDSVPLPDDGGEGPGEPPPTTEPIESNDTIPEATVTNLSAENPTFTVQDAINATRETRNLIDASEDVDLYAVDMGAGDSITVDVDSIEYSIEGIEVPQRLDSVLQVFNDTGDVLLSVDNAPAPDEIFVSNRDAYLTFTAETAGTFYIGVSQRGNTIYDPFTAGSGSGRISPNTGINIGEYELAINLTPGVSGMA